MVEKGIKLNVLFGHIAIRQMPPIFPGRLFGWPHEVTKYDGNGNLTERYYTPPAAWMVYE